MRWLVALLSRMFGRRDASLCVRCGKCPGKAGVCPTLYYLTPDAICNCCDDCRSRCGDLTD